jgi:cysteine desulfurase
MSSARRAIYLDFNATAPLRPEAKAVMLTALDAPGNASSVHGAGRRARDLIETARTQVAALVGASSQRLVFTSGGTEASAIALSSLAAQPSTLIIGATEHDAVMQTALALGQPVEMWPVDGRGVADLDWLKHRLARRTSAEGVPVVALMLANNETGVVQPVAEAATLTHAAGGRLHVDAVQAAGKIAVDMESLGADTLALSAHKLGGPQGAGALVFAADMKPHALWRGGGQEQGLRPGTENVCAIAGFGAAAETAGLDLARLCDMAPWRDTAAARLKAVGAVVAGEGAVRLPNTLCLAASNWDSARQVMWLDLGGVQASAGSACSSGKVKASGVLTVMGLGAQAGFALRASGGWATTEDDWSAFADLWLDGYARVMARQRTEVA